MYRLPLFFSLSLADTSPIFGELDFQPLGIFHFFDMAAFPVVSLTPEPRVHTFFDQSTGCRSFIVADPNSRRAIIIDPILDASDSQISTTLADEILGIARQHSYTIDRVLETCASCHHKSAAWYLRSQIQQMTGVAPRVNSGKSFAGVQRMFERKYGIIDAGWARTFDSDFYEGQRFDLGGLPIQVWRLPGHSPDHLGFLIGRNIFVGDPSITENPDASKSDFNDESAHLMWTSIQRLLSLPKDFRIYTSQGTTNSVHFGRASASVEELRANCRLLVTQ